MESEAAERENAWYEANAKDKVEMARIADGASEKVEAEAEARVTEKAYAVKRAAEEAVAEIRARAEAKIAKRERGKRLRQGPRLRLRSRKRRRR